MYAPTILFAKSISPVDELSASPAGVAEKAPPGKPVTNGVGLPPDIQYVADVYTNEASSSAIVTVAVAEAARQEPLAGIVFTTVYVPGVLAVKSISPVLALTKTSPAGVDEKIPALAPEANTGSGLVPFGQNVAEE